MIRLSCVQNGLWPDYRAFKVTYVQTIVRSKLHMSRLSCVQNFICPDYRAFKIAYVQTIVRSKLHMSRLSCVQNCICPDYRAFKIAYVQTIVRSEWHMSRLSCVQNCICPDYRAFKIAYVQTILRSKLHMSRLSCVHFFPDRVILNARRHHVRSIRILFLEIGKNMSKMVLSVQFFNFIADYGWSRLLYYCTKIDDLMTKTIFGDRKCSDTFFGNR